MRSALILALVCVAGAAAADPDPVIKVDHLKGALPPGVKASGSLDNAVYFGDKNGLNYVLFSSKGHKGDSMYLFLDHWVVPPGGKAKLLRTVKELLEPCDGDMDLAAHNDAFGVTDLDHDGKAEITFGYETTCRSDVSSATYKLLLLEDGAKYILRGTTRIETNGYAGQGGDYTADPAQSKWPKRFFEHATALWDKTADDLQIPPGSNNGGGGAANPCGN